MAKAQSFYILIPNIAIDSDFMQKIKRNRKVRRGMDIEKTARIWTILAQAGDWLHIAEISRRAGIDESTVRWYLDHYLDKAIDQERIVPGIKLRLVKLKPNMNFEVYIKTLNLIKQIKTDKND